MLAWWRELWARIRRRREWLDALTWALIGLAGCAPIGGRVQPVTPKTQTAGAEAAAAFVRAYREGLAAGARECAAADFATWEQAFADWKGRARSARERASAAFDARINQAFTSEFDGDFDRAAWARLMGEIADGFEGGEPP